MQFYDQEEDRRERRKENPKRNKGPNYDLLSMDDYLELRCRSRILQDLNRWLQEERPAEEEEPVPRGRILPGEWSMFRFDYWRLNRTDMKIQILTDAWVRTDSAEGPGQQRCRLYLKYWFSWAGRTEEADRNLEKAVRIARAFDADPVFTLENMLFTEAMETTSFYDSTGPTAVEGMRNILADMTEYICEPFRKKLEKALA